MSKKLVIIITSYSVGILPIVKKCCVKTLSEQKSRTFACYFKPWYPSSGNICKTERYVVLWNLAGPWWRSCGRRIVLVVAVESGITCGSWRRICWRGVVGVVCRCISRISVPLLARLVALVVTAVIVRLFGVSTPQVRRRFDDPASAVQRHHPSCLPST